MNRLLWVFPGDPVVRILPCNAGGTGSIPGVGTKIPQAKKKERNPSQITGNETER